MQISGAQFFSKLNAVCPIVSLSMGDNTAATIAFTPDISATPDQIAAGKAWIAALTAEDISPTTTTKIPVLEFFQRFTDQEHAAIWLAAPTDPIIGVGLINAMSSQTVDVSDSVLASWIAEIVKIGAITADRVVAITAAAPVL